MRARVGKIARLPLAIREELNRRMLDGEPARKIMAWLNPLPETQAVLAEFQGLPIDDRNISDWRHGGFADWLRRREHVQQTRSLAEYSMQLARAGGGKLSEGAAAILSGQLLEVLEAAADPEQKLDVKALREVVNSVVSLRQAEIAQQRADTDEEKLKRKDEELKLAREKFQRESVGIALRVLADERAKTIEAGTGTNAEKIELMGRHLFGELWQPRQ